MSGYATPTTPTSRAGTQRSFRASMMMRRRVLSDSAVTTSTGSGPRRTLLADMPEASISDFRSSKAPSTVNLDSIARHMRSQWRKTPESSNPSTPLTPEHESTSAESLSHGRSPARDPSTHIQMTPFVHTVIHEKEQSHERRPSIKGFFSSFSKLDPRKLSRRRPSETSVESDRTLVPAEQPVIDIQRPLSLTYDPDTQRFTGLEAWETLFPNETRDPFAGLEVPAAPIEETSPLTPTQWRQALGHRINQKLGSLASKTKARLPRTFQFLINPVESRLPPREDSPLISFPFNLRHELVVTEDPHTGRLVGLPEEWQPPPANRTRYSSLSSLIPPSRTSRRSSMPSTPRNRSQSDTTSSSDEPRATQAAPPSPNRASTTTQGQRRLTQPFSGPINGARWAPTGLFSPSTDKRPALENRTSSQEPPPPLPEKDPPHEGRVGPLQFLHPQDAATASRQASTYRIPRRNDFPQRGLVGEPHEAMAESSRSPQTPQTYPHTKPFGQARYTPRSSHARYGYL